MAFKSPLQLDGLDLNPDSSLLPLSTDRCFDLSVSVFSRVAGEGHTLCHSDVARACTWSHVSALLPT